MKYLKVAVHERYTAWLNAREIWKQRMDPTAADSPASISAKTKAAERVHQKAMAKFRIEPKEGRETRSDIDMTPILNRRHRSRRRVAHFKKS